MNTFEWIIMAVALTALLVPGILLVNGKGAFLIAGYNTMSPEEKAKYNEKALCKFVGWLIIAYTVGLGLGGTAFALGVIWLGTVLMVLIHIALIIAVIYVNVAKVFRKHK